MTEEYHWKVKIQWSNHSNSDVDHIDKSKVLRRFEQTGHLRANMAYYNGKVPHCSLIKTLPTRKFFHTECLWFKVDRMV